MSANRRMGVHGPTARNGDWLLQGIEADAADHVGHMLH